MKDKINPNLKRLAELTCNPDLELPDLSEKVQEQPLIQTNKLKRDENGKPIIKLTPLEKTAIHTPTEETHNTLLQVYECGGWSWHSGALPTEENYWCDDKEKTAVCAGINLDGGDKEKFGCYGREYYASKGYQILQPQEFYNKQNITDGMIKEINEYFESRKQNER